MVIHCSVVTLYYSLKDALPSSKKTCNKKYITTDAKLKFLKQNIYYFNKNFII